MPTKYTPLKLRKPLEEKIASTEEALSNPITAQRLRQDRKILAEHESDKKKLAEITPPDITEAERPKYKSREQMLREAMIRGKEGVVPKMNTQREQQEAGAGTTGRLMQWEHFWKHHNLSPTGEVVKSDYGAIFEWKDTQRVLHKEAEEFDSEIASVETFRPRKDTEGEIGLAECRHKSYAMPANYNEVIGTEEVSPLQKAIAEIEEEGTATPPTPEKIYKTRGRPCPIIKRDGTVCGANCMSGRDYCLGHARTVKKGIENG